MEQHTCTKCGKQWRINKIKIAMRDKDRLRCTCGEIIISWNEAAMYTAEPIKND